MQISNRQVKQTESLGDLAAYYGTTMWRYRAKVFDATHHVTMFPAAVSVNTLLKGFKYAD